MPKPEKLQAVYKSEVTPDIFGNYFNRRPQPDVLGRAPATPLEIQRAMKGELAQPQNQPNSRPGKRKR